MLLINYRMPEIIACRWYSTTIKTNYFLKKRVLIGNGYKQIAKKYPWVVYQKTPKNYYHSYWTFAFYLKTKKN